MDRPVTGPQSYTRLVRLLRLCRQRNVRAVFVAMPQGEVYGLNPGLQGGPCRQRLGIARHAPHQGTECRLTFPTVCTSPRVERRPSASFSEANCGSGFASRPPATKGPPPAGRATPGPRLPRGSQRPFRSTPYRRTRHTDHEIGRTGHEGIRPWGMHAPPDGGRGRSGRAPRPRRAEGARRRRRTAAPRVGAGIAGSSGIRSNRRRRPGRKSRGIPPGGWSPRGGRRGRRHPLEVREAQASRRSTPRTRTSSRFTTPPALS